MVGCTQRNATVVDSGVVVLGVVLGVVLEWFRGGSGDGDRGENGGQGGKWRGRCRWPR